MIDRSGEPNTVEKGDSVWLHIQFQMRSSTSGIRQPPTFIQAKHKLGVLSVYEHVLNANNCSPEIWHEAQRFISKQYKEPSNAIKQRSVYVPAAIVCHHLRSESKDIPPKWQQAEVRNNLIEAIIQEGSAGRFLCNFPADCKDFHIWTKYVVWNTEHSTIYLSQLFPHKRKMILGKTQTCLLIDDSEYRFNALLEDDRVVVEHKETNEKRVVHLNEVHCGDPIR